MINPVIAADGHTYEREAIEEWLKTHNTSPKTNLKLKHKKFIDNHDKKGEILEFLDKHRELYNQNEVYMTKADKLKSRLQPIEHQNPVLTFSHNNNSNTSFNLSVANSHNETKRPSRNNAKARINRV